MFTVTRDGIFSDLEKYSIGFNDFFDNLDYTVLKSENYPPYNIIDNSNNSYTIEVAISGFSKEEITVYTENGKLYLQGKKEKVSDKKYIHKGLSYRSFTRFWDILDDIQVKEVAFNTNGILEIHLEKIVPENKKKKVWL